MTTNGGTPTVRDLLTAGATRLAEAGIEDERREARAILSEVTRRSDSRLLAHPEDPVDADERDRFLAAVERRADREPFAYIAGHREFYGLDLEVTPSVLIPRPETELLVERAVEAARFLQARSQGDLCAVDLGTGSGAIAIALASQVPGLGIIAVDASSDALEVARRNALTHRVADRIEFRHGDLLEVVSERFNLLVANLPYIPSGDIENLMPEVARHEPRSALDGGPDGTLLVRRTLSQLVSRENDPEVMLFEIGEGQGEALAAYTSSLFPAARIVVQRDYAGLERLLSVWRKR